MKRSAGDTMMYLIDANVVLETLYKRDRWEASYLLLNRIKGGSIKAYMLRFTIHGISAILGNPGLVARFLGEVITWRGLTIADLSIHEEISACNLASDAGLDFDDGLHYYYAKSRGVPIVSFDTDFDALDIRRLEPQDILHTG